MGIYDTEQGPERSGPDVSRLDADLTPWLQREWGTDVFLTEFPYHQYQGVDKPLGEYAKRRMDRRDGDVGPMDLGDYAVQDGPYRTDVVAVRVNRRALRTRIQRLGHHTPLNQPGQGKRRYRRTFLTFMGDGPMRREYWESEHGGRDELRSYGEDSARRAFGWLKKRRFLAPVGGGAWDAVDIPLHVHGGVHALELKVERGEWDTALEQASRASVYADFRWVAMGQDVADRALANTERFQSEGVGLLTVHPEEGVTVHVWAEQCTPEVDRDLLDRYMVERWDVNERVLSELETRRKTEQDPDRDPDEWVPDVPDLIGELQREGLEIEPEPPTVHGHSACFEDEPATEYESEDTEHKPLSAFRDAT